MTEAENRHAARDSLVVEIDLRLGDENQDHSVRMRNLSPRGMMAEGDVKASRGMSVWVNLHDLGWTEGTVAWVQDNRFGVAFRDEIDPSVVHMPSPRAYRHG